MSTKLIKIQPIFRAVILLSLLLFLSECRTYQYRNREYQAELQKNDYEQAGKELDHNKYLKKPKNEVLYAFEKGKLAHLIGDYEASNTYFNQVDLYAEDYKKNAKDVALELIANAQMQPYKIEDFEGVLIHYYKVLNFIYINDYDGALIEAKRINLKLNAINDKYVNKKNKYAQDAFAHILMGMIYELDGDLNNSFIAYRNAFEIYEKAGGTYMNVKIPEQLKKDLIRTASLNGFGSDVLFYEKKFGISMDNIPKKEVILFWENGLSPAKGEWSINFTVIPGGDGIVLFENKELGFSFPFYVNNDEKAKMSDLKIVRIAFPKYENRPSYFSKIQVEIDSKRYEMDLVEDLNYISRETLNDRFVREMSISLLRLFLKQSAELAVRNESEEIGALLSIVNAVTEKADTRQWQTLPNKIYYARIPIEEGETKLEMNLIGANGVKNKKEIIIPSSNKRLQFINFHSLETIPTFP